MSVDNLRFSSGSIRGGGKSPLWNLHVSNTSNKSVLIFSFLIPVYCLLCFLVPFECTCSMSLSSAQYVNIHTLTIPPPPLSVSHANTFLGLMSKCRWLRVSVRCIVGETFRRGGSTGGWFNTDYPRARALQESRGRRGRASFTARPINANLSKALQLMVREGGARRGERRESQRGVLRSISNRERRGDCGVSTWHLQELKEIQTTKVENLLQGRTLSYVSAPSIIYPLRVAGGAGVNPTCRSSFNCPAFRERVWIQMCCVHTISSLSPLPGPCRGSTSSWRSSTASEGPPPPAAPGSRTAAPPIPTRPTCSRRPSYCDNTRAAWRPACTSWRNTTNSWSLSSTASDSYCTRWHDTSSDLWDSWGAERSHRRVSVAVVGFTLTAVKWRVAEIGLKVQRWQKTTQTRTSNLRGGGAITGTWRIVISCRRRRHEGAFKATRREGADIWIRIELMIIIYWHTYVP